MSSAGDKQEAAAAPQPDLRRRGLAEVIEAEKAFLANTRAPAGEPIGLAFSGGGIRSATFNLGVIQALAACRLLSKFHYLSTVSGGGYIGSWLSALIHRSGDGRVERIEAALAVTPENFDEQADRCKMERGPFALLCDEVTYAIQYLRRYANYITPRTGLLSLDTLTAVVTYLRNLQLNFAIILLTFIALLLVPHLAADAVGLFSGSLGWTIGFVGVSAFAVGFAMGEPLKMGLDRKVPWIAAGLALAGCLVAADWMAGLEQSIDGNLPVWTRRAIEVNLLFWIVAAVGRKARRPFRKFEWKKDDADSFGKRGLFFLLGAVVAGALFGAILYGTARVAVCLNGGPCEIDSIARAISGIRGTLAEAAGSARFLEWLSVGIYAPLVLLLASLAVLLQIGIAKRGFSEHDREWLARLGALLLKCSLVWVGVVAIVLLAPPFMRWTGAWLYSGGAAWLVTTLAGLFAAKGQQSRESAGGWKDRLLAVVPYVFVAGLLMLFAWCLHALLTAPFDTRACRPFADDALGSSRLLPYLAQSLCEISQTKVGSLGLTSIGALHVALFIVSLLGAYGFGWRFDINLFAYHQFYRNRLVRCFLGATKYARSNERKSEQRHPNEFTDLDPDDDPRTSDLARPLRDEASRNQHPYHLVNTALNLANPKELGWQTRKAASFVFSPLFAGYELQYASSRRGGYRSMEYYASEVGRPLSGLKLGVPVTISGAAASPNQGYHTSPGLAFLMTVFNVRLGRWCGNTAIDGAWRCPGPVFSNHYLFRELLADTDESSKFLYLSDGGHFENLGIYELVRRRCAVIVACDAGCDPKFEFEDLGNAIRKCETDLGVEIAIDVSPLRPEKENGPCRAHYAVGTIRYPLGDPGTLIYVKNSMTGDETVDIQHYKSTHETFPHESTADQWFDEAQFESYRRLGRHVGVKVFGAVTNEQKIDAALLQEKFPVTA